MPPITPGRMTPGFDSSKKMPEHAQHHQDVGDVRVGDEREEPVAKPDRDGLDRSPRACASVTGPPGRLHLPAVDLRQEVGDALGDQVDDPELDRLALGGRHRWSAPPSPPTPALRPRSRAMVRDEGGRVVLHLPHRLLVHAAAAGSDGMRGADVGGRRHGGDVGGHRDEDAGRRRAGTGGRHVDDHRHRRSSACSADDRAHRSLEPAGRVEEDRRGPGRRRPAPARSPWRPGGP